MLKKILRPRLSEHEALLPRVIGRWRYSHFLSQMIMVMWLAKRAAFSSVYVRLLLHILKYKYTEFLKKNSYILNKKLEE